MNPSEELDSYVQRRQDDLERKLDHVAAEVVGVRIEIAKLQEKSANWGAIAGFISGSIGSIIVSLVIMLITKLFGK